jgi:T5SS/PEP-CTERM-associated repeat protein
MSFVLTGSNLLWAADVFWTNTASGNFTNTANWNPNTVPGDADNANFTNNNTYTVSWTSDATNANAFFYPRSGTVSLNIGSDTWLLTNSFVIGQLAGTTGIVTHTTGTLVVTNADGAAALIVGQSGRGTFNLSGGAVTADQFFVTNGASSTFNFSSGSLDTLHGSTFFTNAIIGNTAGQMATWTIWGGTNNLNSTAANQTAGTSAANALTLGSVAGSTGIVTVTGIGTMLTNSGGVYVGQAGSGSQLLITNQAKVFNGVSTIGNTSAATSNSVIVTDSGTEWTVTGNLMVGNVGTGNQLIITNLGKVFSASGTVGNSGTGNKAVVTDAGSVWSNSTSLIVGGGFGNQLLITNQGQVFTSTLTIGSANGASNNVLTVMGSNSVLNVSGNLVFGTSTTGGASNLLMIAQGGQVTNGVVLIGRGTTATTGGSNNFVIVTDSNSVWYSSGELRLGESIGGNQIIVSNGAQVVTVGTVNIGYGSSFNTALVTGNNSIWSNASAFTVGRGGVSNQLTIANGGMVVNTSGSLGTFQSSNNTVVVTDPGSVWSNTTTLFVGSANGGNRLVITNGGKVYNALSAALGRADSNSVFVSDAGSLWQSSSISISSSATPGVGNRLIVSNGGTVIATSGGMFVGRDTAGEGSVQITGNGSLLQIVGSTLNVGSNGASLGTGSVRITDGGTLEANTIADGFNGSGSISNLGGIYQFTVATPTVTRRSANSTVLTNGTVSFRGITNASLNVGSSPGVTNIVYAGDNTFQLNNSSNASGLASYVFNSVAHTGNPSNYQRLALVDASTWRSATLTIAEGGAMLVSNSTATVAAAFASTGAVHVINSHVRFLSNAVVSGAYVSEPSTNTFAANLTLTPAGSLAGGSGDLFVFERDFMNQSTNKSLFDLQFATVLFTNGAAQHLFESAAFDQGDNFSGIGSVDTNFAIGTMRLAVGDSLRVTGGVANAVYVGVLDLGGIANTNSLTLDINLYYDTALNPYLGGNAYALGAGSLLPYPAIIPEPGSALLLAAALAVCASGLRRRGRRQPGH